MWNAHTKLSEDGRWTAPNKLPPPQKQYTRTRRRHTNQDIVRYVHTLRIQYTLTETNLSRSTEQQQVLRVSSLCWNCLRVEETALRKKGKGENRDSIRFARMQSGECTRSSSRRKSWIVRNHVE